MDIAKDHVINGVKGMMFSCLVRDAALGTFNAQVWRAYRYRGAQRFMVEIRFDDRCGNGHNSFGITGTLDEKVRNEWRDVASGCLHDEIRDWFPELSPLIRWHLSSTDGPMHYIANTLYWLGYSGWCDSKVNSPPNLAHARSTAVWDDMPESMLCPAELRDAKTPSDAWVQRKEEAAKITRILDARLSALLEEFRADMAAAGLAWSCAQQVAA